MDFRDAETIFRSPTITLLDDRFDYGETRNNTLGVLQGVIVVVITHTEWKTPVRIISMRKATKFERKFYEEEILLRY